jgi:hypothetical protein
MARGIGGEKYILGRVNISIDFFGIVRSLSEQRPGCAGANIHRKIMGPPAMGTIK